MTGRGFADHKTPQRQDVSSARPASVRATTSGGALTLLDLQRVAGNRAATAALSRLALGGDDTEGPTVQRLISSAKFENKTKLFLKKGKSSGEIDGFVKQLRALEQIAGAPPPEQRTRLVSLRSGLSAWLSGKGKNSSRRKPVLLLLTDVTLQIAHLDDLIGGSGPAPAKHEYDDELSLDDAAAEHEYDDDGPPVKHEYDDELSLDDAVPHASHDDGPLPAPPVVAPEPPTAAPTAAAAAKYGKSKARSPSYAAEFQIGLYYLDELVANLEKKVGPGGFDSLPEAMKKTYGWSQEDCDKYLHKVKNIGTTNPDKPVVTALKGDAERTPYELHGGGSLTQGQSKEPYDTSALFSKFKGLGWAIYVMDAGGRLFAAQHKVGLFHHSSFLAGGNVSGAGEIKVVNGTLEGITNKSGHYTPTTSEMLQVFAELTHRGVDITTVTYYHIGPSKAQPNSTSWKGSAAAFVDEQK
jgi:hypothetical protein